METNYCGYMQCKFVIFFRKPVLWPCWLSDKNSTWLVKIEQWDAGMLVLSGVRYKWHAYGPADATATASSLFIKTQTGLTCLVLAYQAVLEYEAIKWTFVSLLQNQTAECFASQPCVVCSWTNMPHLSWHEQVSMILHRSAWSTVNARS